MIPDSKGLENHLGGYFKEKESEEDQSAIGSDPQKVIDELVVEVISCNVLEAHTYVELITQEIDD